MERVPGPSSAMMGAMSTPSDRPFLDAAAEDARRIAGDAYYTGCIVHHPGPGRVTLYLANAPETVLEELESLHPGTYAILNDAPRSENAVLEIVGTLTPAKLRDLLGVEVNSFGPTADGYVQVGIRGPFVAFAQATFDAIYGCGVVRVFEDERRFYAAGAASA